MDEPRLFADDPTTPMMEQYFRIKSAHPDALLFFRLGDFYEMFYEDAAIGSRVLEIALTSRQKVPMCGVPYHAVAQYSAKLLRRGYKVAICEQVEDPRLAKGVVKREVIKILTPGTAVEVDPEAAKENVFVAGLFVDPEGWGLALIDISSGEMGVLEGPSSGTKRLVDELAKASPKEIVLPEGAEESIVPYLKNGDFKSIVKSPSRPGLRFHPGPAFPSRAYQGFDPGRLRP